MPSVLSYRCFNVLTNYPRLYPEKDLYYDGALFMNKFKELTGYSDIDGDLLLQMRAAVFNFNKL